jgi:uncharacterized repeat protein (TIGR01451 family)
MKFLSKFKRSTKTAVVAGVVAAFAFGLGVFTSATAENVSFSSTRDCDANAVIYCGAMSVNQLINRYDNGSGSSSKKTIHDIYNYFGISSTEVHQMDNANTSDFSVHAGKVTSTGNVLINGNIVATNALTAGRQYISGSTKVTYNGTTFYTRTPSVSFQSNSLDAFVVKENGKFAYAILASCGNPVKATPKETPKPNYTINKQVKDKGTDEWRNSITVKPGTHVIYRVVVKSTGDAAVRNLRVWDNLPNHVKYVSGTLTRNGNSASASNFFGDGVTIDRLPAGETVTFRFEAIVGPNDTPEQCTDETLTNAGVMKATDLDKKRDTADVNKKCQPKPEYACVKLTKFQNSRTKYTFTTKATADNGAKIVKYVYSFGDSKTATDKTSKHTSTVSHTYAGDLSTDKTYKVKVTVYVSVNGGPVKAVTSAACTAGVTVKAAPAAECTDLVLTQANDNKRNVSAVIKIATSNGAALNSVTYDFGDGSQPQMRNDLQAVSHTYANTVDSATVRATVTFTGAHAIPTSVCQAELSFENEETPPTELVKTGPGSTLALFAVVTAVAAFAHRAFVARRLS